MGFNDALTLTLLTTPRIRPALELRGCFHCLCNKPRPCMSVTRTAGIDRRLDRPSPRAKTLLGSFPVPPLVTFGGHRSESERWRSAYSSHASSPGQSSSSSYSVCSGGSMWPSGTLHFTFPSLNSLLFRDKRRIREKHKLI